MQSRRARRTRQSWDRSGLADLAQATECACIATLHVQAVCDHVRNDGRSQSTDSRIPFHTGPTQTPKLGQDPIIARRPQHPTALERPKRHDAGCTSDLFLIGQFVVPADHHMRMAGWTEPDAIVHFVSKLVTHVPPEGGCVRAPPHRVAQHFLGNSAGFPYRSPVDQWNLTVGALIDDHSADKVHVLKKTEMDVADAQNTGVFGAVEGDKMSSVIGGIGSKLAAKEIAREKLGILNFVDANNLVDNRGWPH